MLLHLIGAEQLRPQRGGVVAVSLCRVSSQEAQMEQIPTDHPVTLPQFELHFEAKTLEFCMGLRSIHRDENRSKACNSRTRINSSSFVVRTSTSLVQGRNPRPLQAAPRARLAPATARISRTFPRPGPSSCRLPRLWVPVPAPELRSRTPLFRHPQCGKAVIALLMTQATAVAPTRPSYARTSP